MLRDVGNSLRAVRLPPEVVSLALSVRAFLTEAMENGEFEPKVDAWMDQANPAFSRALGAHGWLGITFPTEFGGQGAGPLHRHVITEELLAAGAPVASHWIAERQTGPALLRWGTPEQQSRYLPGIARGETYFAIGMSEPDAGSDLASVRSRAKRTSGGWVLNGTKVWTSGAHLAHAMVALVRTSDSADRHAGLSQLIVDLSADGIEIRPIVSMDGSHHFNEVFLQDVFVGDGDLLGTEGNGWRQVTSELAVERSGPERFMSSLPLLRMLLDRRWGSDPSGPFDPVDLSAMSKLVARLLVLREMSLAVANSVAQGTEPATEAAMVKDLGTRFEGDLVDAVARIAKIDLDPSSDDPFVRASTRGVLHTPGFTLRGGTTEMLRTIVARTLGTR